MTYNNLRMRALVCYIQDPRINPPKRNRPRARAIAEVMLRAIDARLELQIAVEEPPAATDDEALIVRRAQARSGLTGWATKVAEIAAVLREAGVDEAVAFDTACDVYRDCWDDDPMAAVTLALANRRGSR